MKKILLMFVICCTSALAQPVHDLDTIFKQAKDPSNQPAGNPESAAQFTTDTQIRMLSLFEPKTNNSELLHVADTATKSADTYLNIENVPLKALFHLLARRAGLNYLEPDSDLQNLDELITLEMKEPQPRTLMDWLLKHRNFELYDAGTGIFTIRPATNQMSFFKFKLKDNFIDRFKGSAQTSTGGGGGGGSMGGMGGGQGGNAVSANASSITVDNGGKYGEIEGLLEKVANTENEKNKVWYYEEKQVILMYGTRAASERVTQYLEIANQQNPNIRIDVRIYATGNNPQSQLGVDWSSMMSPGLTFGLQPPGSAINSSPTGTNSGFATFNTLDGLAKAFGHPMNSLILKNDIQATLNFFVKESRAEAISEPSTITANDREVAFAATQQIPYVSGSASTGGALGGNSGGGYDNTAFVNVGANINILPRIQDGHRLKLGTALSISQLDQMITISSGTGGSAARQVPQTSGRAFNGEFTINSGDTVVIAGLKTHTISKTINKVPLFGDIPGLGKLFRNTSDSKQNNYLTIFITATILDDNNNPRIPEGHITTKDKYPDDENTWMSAEPNSQNLMRNSLIGDKTMINAKREALDLRTEQANRIIANRLKLETQAEALTSAYEQQSTELQDLENQKKQLKKKSTSDGSIERLKADIDTKLTKTKTDREALAKELVECRVGLEKLAKQEVDATKAKEKAETDYTKALKDSILKPAVLPNSQKPAGKSAEDVNNTLDKNKTLLNNL